MKHSPGNIINVSRETLMRLDKVFKGNSYKLDKYADLLLWWNRKVNLVSRNSSKKHILEHIRHSLIPVALDLYSGNETILDTGTGGGLPGIPLAIALPDCRFVLNDISEKKCMVLKQMVKDLGLSNCEVKPGDLGKLTIVGPCILTTKHAFKLNDLLFKAKGINWEQAIIYKGTNYQSELNETNVKEIKVQAYNLSLLEPGTFYIGKSVLVVKKM
ncbi:MAG: RsmG family class I SAM-dependent methyltransferase [Balneolales bacterium]